MSLSFSHFTSMSVCVCANACLVWPILVDAVAVGEEEAAAKAKEEGSQREPPPAAAAATGVPLS